MFFSPVNRRRSHAGFLSKSRVVTGTAVSLAAAGILCSWGGKRNSDLGTDQGNIPQLVPPKIKYHGSSDRPLKQFRNVQTSEEDVLSGRIALKPGDSCPAVYRFSACFPISVRSHCFSSELKEAVIKYQLNNGLNPAGEIDQATTTQLIKDGIIYERKSKFELGPEFFPKVINPDNKADCLRLAKDFLYPNRFDDHAHSIENLLIERGQYQKVVATALEILEMTPELASFEQSLFSRLKTIDKALRLGIERPLILTAENLEQVVANYATAKPGNFNACMLLSSYDDNGAFYNLYGLNELVSYFLRNKANLRIIVPHKDYELKEKFAAALNIAGKQGKADCVVYCFHGYPTGMRVSGANTADAYLDLGEGHLRALNPWIKTGAAEILYACSAANTQDLIGNETLTQSLYQARGRRTTIYAANTKCNLLVGPYVGRGSGDPIIIRFNGIQERLKIKFIAPHLREIMNTGSQEPQAAATILRARK